MTTVLKGQAPPVLGREELHIEFRKSFIDPAFETVSDQLSKEQSTKPTITYMDTNCGYYISDIPNLIRRNT